MKYKSFYCRGNQVVFFYEINYCIYITNQQDKVSDGIGILDRSMVFDLITKYGGKGKEFYLNLIKNTEQISNIYINDVDKANYTLCIHGSRKCNMSCKYCFGSADYLPCSEISVDVAKKAIDFLVYNIGTNAKMFTIDFAGSGEPLLRFDFIKEIEDYCEIIRNKIGKKIILSFPTNATLLKKEHIDYLNQHPDILYGFSIDGDKEHNVNRVMRDGTNSFDAFIKGIEYSSNPHTGFAVTITPQNQNYNEIYDYLYGLKKGDAISSHIVRDFSDSETSIKKLNIDLLIEAYHKLTINIIEHLKNNDINYLIPLLNGDDIYGKFILKLLQNTYIFDYRCDAGRTRFAVDNNGKLYACSVMNGNEDFCVGDIYTGIDYERQKKFYCSSVNEAKQCQNCWAKTVCRGECFAISYLSSGSFFAPNTTMCQIKQRLIEEAIIFIQYVKNEMPESFLKLEEYVRSTKYYFSTNPNVWSVFRYLNCNNHVSYREVSDFIEDKEKNKGILDLVNFTKKYNKENCAVRINSISDITSDNSVLLGIIIRNQEYISYFAEKDDNGKYMISSFSDREKKIELSDELIKKGLNIFIGQFEKEFI